MRTITTLLIGIIGILSPQHMTADDKIEINVNKRENNISPNLYGIFYEDINHSGDGGLYGELIRNRSFEDTQIPQGWHIEEGRLVPRKVQHHFTGVIPERTFPWPKSPIPGWTLEVPTEASAEVSLSQENPYFETAPTSAQIMISQAGNPIRLLNNGFWGISVKAGDRYTLRTILKVDESYDGNVKVMLLDGKGKILDAKSIIIESKGIWNDISLSLVPNESASDAALALEFDSTGIVWADYISLFPEKTFNNRPNGMRMDIAEMLVAMKPTFMRWPGGSTVGGITLDNRFDWKKTLGDPASRPGEYFTWGERCSYGFGYHEMLQFCEDLNMDAMFVCNAGMSDMFRSGEFCAEDTLDFFIDNCLDAIEYAIGASDTEWGAKRAAAGHPKPFPLKYIEVGNEHYGCAYEQRFDKFYNAIKAKYPDIIVVSNHFINGIGASVKTDIVDPHWYGTPNFYFNNTTLFDSIPRGNNLAYIGEWACNFNVGKGNMQSALAEAAFLTGIERNGDYVAMSSYAPLLQNRNDRDWNVSLIWFDNDSVVGRASYYAQCMAAANKADYNVDVEYTGSSVAIPHKIGKIGFGSSKSSIEIKNVKITERKKRTYIPNLKSGKDVHGEWHVTDEGVLQQTGTSGNSLYVLNDFESNDFILECDVKRNSFKEGVFIFYNITDSITDAVRYNVGGWNCELLNVNALYDGLDVGAVGPSAKCSVMPDEWHHVKLVVTPMKSTLILDENKSLSFVPKSTPEHFVCAGMDDKTNELILKVVNRGAKSYAPEIILNGVDYSWPVCKVITLSASDDKMENSFENPRIIYPIEETIRLDRQNCHYTFKPYSYTILRIKTQ